MKEIRFPSTLSMDYPGLLSEALGQVMEVPYGETLTVDLTDTQRVSAFGVAALGARLAWLVAAKRLPSGSVIRRPENGRVSNDLMRMGLYNLLQEASVNIYTGDKMGERPQELWLVENPQDLDNACARLVSILRSVLPASDGDFKRVNQMLMGLGDNAFRHGKVHTGAMLCGQAFPKNGVVEIAAADTGQGMWASLKRFPNLMESLQGDANGILTALTLKVRSADGAVRPGFLNTLLATARKTGGEMVCMSGEAALTLRGGEMRNSKVPFYPGTVVGLRLRLLSQGEAEPLPEA
ncbi:MAG TPA: hypothetical protein VNZ54_01660 [bacterium]|jgi:hypothetical protein|nr:hypothetical protein [bacterium]HXC63297.1 hypothetical protein [bacterium]